MAHHVHPFVELVMSAHVSETVYIIIVLFWYNNQSALYLFFPPGQHVVFILMRHVMDPRPRVLLLNIVVGSLWRTNTLQFLYGVP